MPAKKPSRRRTSTLGPRLCSRPAVRPHKPFRIVLAEGQPVCFHHPVEITPLKDVVAEVRFPAAHEDATQIEETGAKLDLSRKVAE